MKKQTKTYLFSLVFILIIGLMIGCRESSGDVNQAKIHTEYELYYDANDDKTYARATFKFGNILGTLLELSDSSQVSFNGQTLSFKNALAYYERDFAGFVPSGTFVWTDTEGNSYTNTISITAIAHPANADTINRSQSYTYTWSGSPLVANENLSLTINGENEADAQLFFTDDDNASSMILPKDKLEKIGAGPGKMYLDRRYMPALQQKTEAGGVLTGRYRPIDKNIVLN